MYENYYGFEKKPFSISPDPDFLYLNENYREAMALLRYGVYDVKGIVSLIGEVGTGKTMLLNELLQSFDDRVTALTIPSQKFSHDELVEYILARLGVSAVADRSLPRLEMLRRQLEAMSDRNENVVLLVDEAQTLDNETLESLRLLSNVETPKRKLLPILLVGQPELQDKLNLPELRQFKQRIIVSFRLRPLAPEEVPQYMAHRLKGAGYAHGLTLFSDEALRLVSSYSGGIPRLINALCDNALLSGYAQERHRIDGPIIQDAAKDLVLHKQTAETSPVAAEAPKAASRPLAETKLKFRYLWAAASVALLVVVVAGYFVFSKRQHVGNSLSSDHTLNTTGAAARASAGKSSSLSNLDAKAARPEIARTPATAGPASEPANFGTEEKRSVNNTPSTTSDKTAQRTRVANGVGLSAVMSVGERGQVFVEHREPTSPVGGLDAAFQNGQMQTESSSSRDVPLSPRNLSRGERPKGSADKASTSGKAAGSNPHGPESRESDRLSQSERRSATKDELSEKRRGTIRAIKRGQTILSVARELYGDAGPDELALIQAANPNIKNLDLVFIGQEVLFPDLSEEQL